jgi:threonine/homoserine/homoserine lactone efflux protein
MLSLALQGIGLGFTAGSSFGPLQTFLINTTLAQGWRRSALMVFSPLIADIPVVIIMVFVLNGLPDVVVRLLQVGGGLFLWHIAYGTWMQIRAGKGLQVEDDSPMQGSRLDNLRRAVAVNLLSPGPYIFWGTVNGPLLKEGLSYSLFHALAFMLGFYVTFLGIMTLIMLVFNSARRLDPRVIRAMLIASVAILAIFGLKLIADGLGLTFINA